jgi:hypothetical protein
LFLQLELIPPLTKDGQMKRARFTEEQIIAVLKERGLDRRNTLQLAQGAWLKAYDNFIITGLTGTGKKPGWPMPLDARRPGLIIPSSICG